ncbi:unnamed protein product [Mytilus coruscus]|uniref:COR domain-containing protein n=1 Tax=Mytilus coruscus TaxID=42192 RepID=A0A6J8BFM8_MYTCO|nr:unnamed protein product [Mytilus coruscus]
MSLSKRNITGRAHSAAHSVNFGPGDSVLELCIALHCEVPVGGSAYKALKDIQKVDIIQKQHEKSIQYKQFRNNSEEAELNTRLLKPFQKKLKGQVNSESSTERPGFKVIKDKKPKGLDETKHMTKYMNSSSHSNDKLRPPKVFASHEKQPKHPVDQVHKEIESMLKVYAHDKEEYATLLLWDFAGDKEFYHTHQTFLSADAIYLVVTKLNEADNKEAQGMFRLWMDSIHCYCRSEKQNTKSGSNTAEVKDLTDQRLDPPVILVGTCKDQIEIAEGEEMENSCMERLGIYTADVSLDVCRHVVEEGKYCISNTEDKRTVFQEIREYILKLAKTMKSWNRDYPLKFIQLEKLLQEKRQELPIISFQQIQHLSTTTLNPLNDEELNLFLKFHHEIRALVFFEDLPNYIILDTQWLSDAFKCIVTAEKFQWTVRSIKNRDKWDDLNQRGILHDEVLIDIFKEQQTILSKHKDHILNVMEKFDIIIRPIISDGDVTDEKSCYYVPCMVKEKPEDDIYKMFKVMANTCKKSTWFCLKFSFLPPHLMNHLIASLCREYEVSKFADTIQEKKLIALFRDTAVFDLQKTRLQKLLVTTCPNLIQIQVLEFKTNAVIKRGSYSHIADFVEGEIIKIISTRFKMTNVTFEKKWECGCVMPEFVTGSIDFIEEQNTEYFCETCTASHKFTDEWSKKQRQKRGSKRLQMDESESPKKKANSKKTQSQLSQNFGESNCDTADSKPTVISAKLHFPPGALNALSKLSEGQTRKTSSRVFTKKEFRFAKMGMIVLNILADVLFDLLKQDKGNVKPRSECDITYLYSEHRKLNKHIPSYSSGRGCPPGTWGGTWGDIKNTDISTGDDIERIRLTRNELQHYKTFKLEHKRYNDLCNIILELLERFDKRNNPTKLYTEQLNDILARTLSDDEVNGVQIGKIALTNQRIQ